MNSTELVPTTVLIIEDETDLQQAMVDYLRLDGFVAEGVGELKAADQWLATHDCDVLLLDLGLPDGDGLAWLLRHPGLRSKGIIITTARAQSADRVVGAKGGADVYLVKPLQLEELSAVLGNLGRRIRPAPAAQAWVLDATRWVLRSPQGLSVKLTLGETRLLGAISGSPGAVVARDRLIERLGENPLSYDPRRLEILVRRLRNKAKTRLCCDLPLETVYGEGYAFTAPIRSV
jgi:DNA-binding response OmpR family regulator